MIFKLLSRLFGSGRSQHGEYGLTEPPFEMAASFGGIKVIETQLPGATVSTVKDDPDLMFTWADVEDFSVSPEIAGISPLRQAIAISYTACVGKDKFPLIIQIDPAKLPASPAPTPMR